MGIKLELVVSVGSVISIKLIDEIYSKIKIDRGVNINWIVLEKEKFLAVNILNKIKE
jgi:hypothetical protein